MFRCLGNAALSSLPVANGSGQTRTVCVLKMAACIRNGVCSPRNKNIRSTKEEKGRGRGREHDILTLVLLLLLLCEHSKPWKRDSRRGRERGAAGRLVPVVTPFVTCRRKEGRSRRSRPPCYLEPDRNKIISLSLSHISFDISGVLYARQPSYKLI